MTYRAPLPEMRFTLNHVIGLEPLLASGAYDGLDPALIDSILEEAAKLAEGEIAPLNRGGDLSGAVLENGVVRTAPGFKAAYRKFIDGGWNGLAFPADHGGQGLPWTLALAVQEMWQSANMAFSLCPLLTQGAIEAIAAHGSAGIKAKYLSKLVSGEWTGTMNLTEAHAGSDVGALTAKAERASDGSYRISGTKIFITYGEHDMTDNIVHLVLARLPEAPIGTRGISLFLVPKFLPERNGVQCTGLEKKLGIHASPTCVMTYEQAQGWVIGEENRGMACMFTMMNNARLSVGLQGTAIGERAFQQALAYAQERRQGKPFGLQHESREMVPIIHHPDVRRNLWSMKSLVQATRAICYATANAIDLSRVAPDSRSREAMKLRAEFLTPIAKGFSTDKGCEIASIGVQIHGGAGFIEETGAAQHYRDARIAPIYEGTNGIQAIDLVTRKLPLEGGAVLRGFLAEMIETAGKLRSRPGLAEIGDALETAAKALEASGDWLLARVKSAPNDALAGATPFLRQAGITFGGWLLGKGALAGQDGHAASALFYARNILSEAPALHGAVIAGNAGLAADFD